MDCAFISGVRVTVGGKARPVVADGAEQRQVLGIQDISRGLGAVVVAEDEVPVEPMNDLVARNWAHLAFE